MNLNRASQLRQEFDAAFASEFQDLAQHREGVLLIGVGEREYGLRLSQIDGVAKGKSITNLPDSPAEQLGIVGWRGQLVTVFSLSILLAEPAGDSDWLAWVKAPGGSRVAFAFDSLQGQLSVEQTHLLEKPEQGHIDSLIQRTDDPLPVISVPSLLQRLCQER